jgi:hypothetical protein
LNLLPRKIFVIEGMRSVGVYMKICSVIKGFIMWVCGYDVMNVAK